MNRHALTLIACILPLALLFLLPSMGVGTEGLPLLLLLAACFVVHLLLMGRIGKNNDRSGKGGSHDAD